VARGRRRVRAPARGAVSAGAAKAHGKRREGDEQGADERQRLTESSKARGRTEEEDIGEEGDDAQWRTVWSLARLSEEENEGGQRSRGKTTSRGSCWALMARPETVGAALPTRTVARPPFWLAALVVTTGMARSGVFTDVSSCLPHSPSRVEYYHGKETGRDKLS